jgi:lipid II:glycine glycyltransferase (peptidoglycan interpeptide bridge formation enzyme)
MTLDVRSSEAELRKVVHTSTKLYLDRAVKRGAVIEYHTSAEGVARLHRLLSESGRRKGMPVRSEAYFHTLREQYLSSGNGCLITVVHEGVDLTALLAIRFGRLCQLLYSALAPDSNVLRALRPGPAIHWEMIRWAKQSGCELIDWGGSGTGYPPEKSDRGYGIYQFKSAFGCTLQLMIGYYDLVLRPGLYWAFRLSERHVLPKAWTLRSKLNAFQAAHAPPTKIPEVTLPESEASV